MPQDVASVLREKPNEANRENNSCGSASTPPTPGTSSSDEMKVRKSQVAPVSIDEDENAPSHSSDPERLAPSLSPGQRLVLPGSMYTVRPSPFPSDCCDCRKGPTLVVLAVVDAKAVNVRWHNFTGARDTLEKYIVLVKHGPCLHETTEHVSKRAVLETGKLKARVTRFPLVTELATRTPHAHAGEEVFVAGQLRRRVVGAG